MKKLSVIYTPKGRAKEYSEYALNIYNGCNFGCKYCFAPLVLKRDREDFHKNILERKSFLAKLESDCKKLEGMTERVLLCFVSDPYNDLDSELKLTREVLILFKKYNISFHVLTKGGMRATRDFDLYKNGDAYATTLTFLEENKSIEWEPNAMLPIDRIESLKVAKKKGIETWVSLEPVIEPLETLKLIDATHEFVDFYKVGKLNYSKESDKVDWVKFAKDVILKLETNSKSYYLKADLKKYL